MILLMKTFQLDMFKNNDEVDELRHEIEMLEKSHHKVRRRLFAEIKKLEKLYMGQASEFVRGSPEAFSISNQSLSC